MRDKIICFLYRINDVFFDGEELEICIVQNSSVESGVTGLEGSTHKSGV